MSDKPHGRRDRYDISGNVEAEFADEAKTVLANLQGIVDLATLQLAERKGVATAYETLLNEVRADTNITVELVRHMHKLIFGGLYAWAGQWRTVWISKPGITWPAPDFIEPAMLDFERSTLHKYPAELLDTDAKFCQAAAEIQGEFLVIHPFREGNARTIKMATNLLAVQTARPFLNYDESEAGIESYSAAAAAAFKRDYGPMAAIIRAALAAAQ